MGDGIGGSVLGKEEGGDLRGARVVAGCRPEFEEVEGGEGGYEEGGAPEGRIRGGVEEQVDG